MSQAGWYPDPTQRHQYRYFNSERWTEHVSDHGVSGVDWQLPGDPGATAAQPTAAGDPFAPPPVAGPSAAPASPTATYDHAATRPNPTTTVARPADGVGGPPSAPPPPTTEPDDGSFWKKWWVWAGVAAVVVAGIIAAVVIGTGGDDDEVLVSIGTDPTIATTAGPTSAATVAPTTTAPTTTVATGPTAPVTTSTTVAAPATTVVPDTAAPELPADALAIGEVASFGEAQVRVSSVVRDYDTGFDDVPGITYTAFDVVGCGPGTDLNPFGWSVMLDDGTEASVDFYSLTAGIVRLADGCARTLVNYEVPTGSQVVSIEIVSPDYSSVALWAVEGELVPTVEELPGNDPTGIALGETQEFGDGATVTLQSYTADVEVTVDYVTLPVGTRLDRIETEICAGDETISVDPLNFTGLATDRFMGSTQFIGDTLEFEDVAPGDCVSGIVELVMPTDAPMRHVLYADLGEEVARWTLDEPA